MTAEFVMEREINHRVFLAENPVIIQFRKSFVTFFVTGFIIVSCEKTVSDNPQGSVLRDTEEVHLLSEIPQDIVRAVSLSLNDRAAVAKSVYGAVRPEPVLGYIGNAPMNHAFRSENREYAVLNFISRAR